MPQNEARHHPESDAQISGSERPVALVPVAVSVIFKKSLGNLRAAQSRDGNVIASGDTDHSGAVALGFPQSGDVISVNGESEGSVTVHINVPTDDPTPIHFGAGRFSHRVDVL